MFSLRRKKPWLGLSSLLILSLVSSGCRNTDEPAPQPDQGSSVSNVLETPYASIFLIRIGEGQCTGFLAGSRTVITAAHCFKQETAVKDVKVYVPEEDGGFRALAIADYEVSKRYDPKTAINDYAALILKTPVDRKPFKLVPYSGKRGDVVYTAGWTPTPDGQKFQMLKLKLTVLKEEPEYPGLVNTYGGADSGHSGSPIEVKEKGNEVFGVLAKGDENVATLFSPFDEESLKEIKAWLK